MDSEAHAVRREPTGDHERSRIEEKMASSNRYVCTVLEESRAGCPGGKAIAGGTCDGFRGPRRT